MADSEEQTGWRKATLPVKATLGEAVRNLTESALQIILVISPDGSLAGTITDGDIRRGLLRGLDMQSPIDSVVKRAAMVAPLEMSRESALKLMQTNRIMALPIVDERRHLVGLHLLRGSPASSQRPNTMVIMAGGKGTRLGDRTSQCPKPLLKVNDKPMLEHIIERARSQGLSRFVISLNHLGHMIEAHFGDGGRWNVQIEYLREEQPLGTAGALSLLRPRPTGPFLVTNGDVITDIDYGEMLDFHTRSGAAATMAVRLHEWQHPFGVVLTRGLDIVGFDEKPVSRTHVNAGIYALNPDALECLSEGEHCHMPAVFERLKDAGSRTIVYPMHEAWVDFGRPEDFGAHRPAG